MVTLTWRGASHRLYEYHSAIMTEGWQQVPVNYMFVRLNVGGQFVAYIGESDNAHRRFPTHERWDEAVRKHGVTHVFNHVGSNDQSVRRAEEKDLIAALCPPMNTHHQPDTGVLSLADRLYRTGSGLGGGLINQITPNPLDNSLANQLYRLSKMTPKK